MVEIAKETESSVARLSESSRKRLGDLARKLEEKRRELTESQLLREAEMKALRSEMKGREAKWSSERTAMQNTIGNLKEVQTSGAQECESLSGRVKELEVNMKGQKTKHKEAIEDLDRRRKEEFDKELGEWETAKVQYEEQVSGLEKGEKQLTAERNKLLGQTAALEKDMNEMKAKHQKEIAEFEQRRTAELDEELDELEHLLNDVKSVGPDESGTAAR